MARPRDSEASLLPRAPNPRAAQGKLLGLHTLAGAGRARHQASVFAQRQRLPVPVVLVNFQTQILGFHSAL